jgi:hypothetical protein
MRFLVSGDRPSATSLPLVSETALPLVPETALPLVPETALPLVLETALPLVPETARMRPFHHAEAAEGEEPVGQMDQFLFSIKTPPSTKLPICLFVL